MACSHSANCPSERARRLQCNHMEQTPHGAKPTLYQLTGVGADRLEPGIPNVARRSVSFVGWAKGAM